MEASNALSAAIDFTGGVAGGIAGVYTGQPLDTVKVKVQTFPHLYRSALNCFLVTYRQDGIRGLYAGTVPALVANVAENAVLFLAYGQCQKVMVTVMDRGAVSELTILENALSGGSAAFFSSLALCPTELVKCRLQAARELHVAQQRSGCATHATQHQVNSAWSVTRTIVRTEGPLGLFRGLQPTFAREMPGYCCFFGAYECCRSLLTPPGCSRDDLGSVATVFCGGMGGVALWTAVFPADVIKSRAQVQLEPSCGGFWRTALFIVKHEGVSGLYRGLVATLIRTFISTGALFLAYENTKKHLTHIVTTGSI